MLCERQPRDSYKIPTQFENDLHDSDHANDAYQYHESFNPRFVPSTSLGGDGESYWSRMEIEPTIVDAPSSYRKGKGKRKEISKDWVVHAQYKLHEEMLLMLPNMDQGQETHNEPLLPNCVYCLL